jgi:hypothetical protein
MTALAVVGGNLFAGCGAGVFLSTNNGANWRGVNHGLISLGVTALVSQGNRVFAGTTAGVFRLTDGDTNWISTNTGISLKNIRYEAMSVANYVSALCVNGDNLFAGSFLQNGIFRSTNNLGTNWTRFNEGLDSSGLSVTCFLVSGRKIFVGTKWQGLYTRTF